MRTYREARKFHRPIGSLASAAAAFALIVTAAQTPLLAETTGGKRPGPLQACQADVKSLCADASAGGDRKAAAKCLADHRSELAAPCLGALRRARRVAAFRRACGPSVKSLCGGVTRGDGRILACLRQNEASLGDDCKLRVAQRKTKKGQNDVAAVASEALAEERAGVEPLGDALSAVPEEAPLESVPPATPAPPASPETAAANAQ